MRCQVGGCSNSKSALSREEQDTQDRQRRELDREWEKLQLEKEKIKLEKERIAMVANQGEDIHIAAARRTADDDDDDAEDVVESDGDDGNVPIARRFTVQASPTKAEKSGWRKKAFGISIPKMSRGAPRRKSDELEAPSVPEEDGKTGPDPKAKTKGKSKSKAKGKAKSKKNAKSPKEEEMISDHVGDVHHMKSGHLLELFPDAKFSKKRYSVLGDNSPADQQDYEEKNICKQGKGEIPGVGYVCKKGHKPFVTPNQDDFSVFLTDTSALLGVFDGHGQNGHDVANFVHKVLPATIVKDGRFNDDPQKAMRDAFETTHDKVVETGEADGFDTAVSGTTATVALIKDGVLFIAHAGDTRGCIGVAERDFLEQFDDEDAPTIECIELTQDHKCDIEEEQARLEAAGAEVYVLPGDIPHRVFVKGKNYPALAMSRSIGDTKARECGVISTPDVDTWKIEDNFRFLILASDGVWEFVTSQEAVDIVCDFPPDEVQTSAEALAAEAWNRWVDEEEEIVDDITVLVYWFHGDK